MFFANVLADNESFLVGKKPAGDTEAETDHNYCRPNGPPLLLARSAGAQRRRATNDGSKRVSRGP
ncbi:MAG: hypothetical protein MK006_03530 [Pirellulales bacterium]|nr:hypothetical protein [Pirellulales bacterium]